ncbi:ABC-type multidrug transport system, ATPase and permease component [Corynebacterium mustelae]|uniref:ABC-type multidrug transport system, ATPase and permease component n=1 Tax=Corynebacterium mustelae TaxID=571915 RepID=A0A0G3GWU7_9CORY|nr:ABC transporter ATP-binding protein [Corynebacterium mustelae]AKK05030.1 ABC-type multidrug transport system, ATPase and permease component [Corynebacterium mustelae]
MTSDGSVLVSNVTNEKAPPQENPRVAGKKALNQLLEPVRGRLLLGRVLAVIAGILAIAPYVALVQLGDILYSAYLTDTPIDSAAVWRAIFLLINAFCLRLFIVGLALGVTHFADIKISAIIRQLTISRLAQAPLGWFSTTNAGKVRKALHDDIAQIHTLIAHQPVDVTQAIVTPIALVAYAFTIDWRLGLLTVAALPLYGAANVWMMQGMGEKTAQMDAHLARVSATMVEFFTGISVVKAFGTVGKSHQRYQDAANDFRTFYGQWVTPLLRGSAMANAAIAIPVLLAINIGGGALMVSVGWVSPIEVLATTLIGLMVPSSIEVLAGMVWSYQIAGAAALRVTAALQTPSLAYGDMPVHPISNEVVFDNVSFSYGLTRAADSVSMTLRENSVTALVGPSGSGKSTLAMLLARFNDPDSGTITVGGVDIRTFPMEQLYQTVAFVLQDPQLTATSVRDNIALGKPNATDTEIIEAARAAHILDVIKALPNGLDTIVGAETNFSGGQAQRVAIARALLIDAPVLILDEATAFADPESEAEIQAALSTLVTGRTVLVIAHRPESILGVDQIVILDTGKVIACGRHADLKEQPLYQQLMAARPHSVQNSLPNIRPEKD